jgi:hypothetical protein
MTTKEQNKFITLLANNKFKALEAHFIKVWKPKLILLPDVADKMLGLLNSKNIHSVNKELLYKIISKHTQLINNDIVYNALVMLIIEDKNIDIFDAILALKNKKWLNIEHLLNLINFKDFNTDDQINVINFVRQFKNIKVLDWLYSNINKPEDEYISKEHYEYCKNPEENITIKYPEVEQVFNVNFDVFTITFNPEFLDNISKNYTKFIEKNQISLKYLVDSNYNKTKLSFQDDFQNISKNILWIDECSRYIQDLSIKDKLILYGYTCDSSYPTYFLLEKYTELNKLIEASKKCNKYRNYYFPLYISICEILLKNPELIQYAFPKEIKKESERYIYLLNNLKNISNDTFYEAIKQYINDLNRICSNAPKLQNDLYIYRGERDDYTAKYQEQKELIIPNFQSSSIAPSTALNFASWNGVFKRIKIPKGTSCIYIQNISRFSELEVILNKDTKLTIDNVTNVKYAMDNSNEIKDRICLPMKPFTYYEMTVHP